MRTQKNVNSLFQSLKCFHQLLILFLFIVFLLLFQSVFAQSAFSNGHGNSERISATVGLLFYKQIVGQFSVNEGVEQGYLLGTDILDDACAQQTYANFDFEWGDTLVPGIYRARKYLFNARNHYDSVVTLTLYVHPNVMQSDTIIVAEGDSLSAFPGVHRDTFATTFGCDSIVELFIAVVSCPADISLTADYGEMYVPITLLAPQIIPSTTSFIVISDYSGDLEVGLNRAISWQIIGANDTFRCAQNVRVDFPPCGGDFVVADGNGNNYETVRVGANCWMKQSLRATLYANGDTIPVARVVMACNDTVPRWQNYGFLYSWYSAMNIPEGSHNVPTFNGSGEVQGACPLGWHLPSATDMAFLLDSPSSALRLDSDAWVAGSSNASGFSALPSGKFDSVTENFENQRIMTSIWCSNEVATGVAIIGEIKIVCPETDMACSSKFDGNSVRCIKD